MLMAAAVDGRIGPGSIPAVLQGRNWAPGGGWSVVSVPAAPVGPVWQAAAAGANIDLAAPTIPVIPGQTLVLSGWFRAAQPLNGSVTLTMVMTPGPIYAVPIKLIPGSEWTYRRAAYLVPAGKTFARLVLTLQGSANAGTAQVCGLQLSIIGAMPAP